MPLLIFALIGLIFVQTASFNLIQASRAQGQTEIMQQARREADLYRSFALAAQYVLSKEPFVGETVQTRTWAQIRSSPHAPAHLRNIEVPATWRVRGTSSAWTICAEVSEHAIGLLKATLPAQDPLTGAAWRNTIVQGGQTFWVLGESDATKQTLYATWCQA